MGLISARIALIIYLACSKITSVLTETVYSDKHFEYFSELDFIVETNLGCNSRDQMCSFDEKTEDQNLVQVYL